MTGPRLLYHPRRDLPKAGDLSRALAQLALPHVDPNALYPVKGEELLQLKALAIQLCAMEQRAMRRAALIKDVAAMAIFLACAGLAAWAHYYG